MASSDGSEAGKKLFFNDEETLSTIASKSMNTDDLKSRLEGLQNRFLRDCGDLPVVWEPIIRAVEDLQLNFSYSDVSIPNPSSSVTDLPAAFQTAEGKEHLEATSSVLSLSNNDSVQVTLSTLQSLAAEPDDYPKLLGSRAFLEKVIDFHFHQRLARLAVLTESLRTEQAETQETGQTEMIGLLDTIDALSTDQNRNPRGLFRLLLLVACRPRVAPSYDQLRPARRLSAGSNVPKFTGEYEWMVVDEHSAESGEWEAFKRRTSEYHLAAMDRERLQALEALMMLLYERVSVNRVDFIVLLVAIRQKKFFSGRASRLASLLCASCTSLWRVMNEGWVDEHPLLSESASRTTEMQVLADLVVSLGNQAANRLKESKNACETPEAVAALAVGLIFTMAGQADEACQELGTTGVELVTFANVRGLALTQLYYVMDDLVDELPDPEAPTSRLPSDFYAVFDEPNNNDLQTSPMSVAYASIGREVLGTTIMAFPDAVRNSGPENLEIIANLASVVFRNNSILCQEFWATWEDYAAIKDDSGKPFCVLLETTHNLAANALFQGSPQMLTYVAPHLRLISSLVYNPDVCEEVLRSLPPGLISTALDFCVNGTLASETAKRSAVLNSIHDLARIGRGVSCHDLLRSMLPNGPRSLSGIAVDFSGQALSVLSLLTRNAPDRWLNPVSVALRQMLDTRDRWAQLIERDPRAVVQLVGSLVTSISRVAFSQDLHGSQKANVLSTVGSAVQSSISILSTSLSVTSPSHRAGMGLCRSVIECVAGFLTQLRPIICLCDADELLVAAKTARDQVLHAIGACHGVSQAIMYFATAPISLALLTGLDALQRDQDVLKAARAKGMTSFQKLADPEATKPKLMSKKVLDLLHSGDVVLSGDTSSFVAQGWLRPGDMHENLFAVSGSALRLLLQWATSTGEIAKNDGVESTFLETWGPSHLLFEQPAIPGGLGRDQALREVWTSSSISNLFLLSRYLTSDTPTSTSLLTFDFLQICLSHLQVASPDSTLNSTARDQLYSPELSSTVQLLLKQVEKLYGLQRLGLDEDSEARVSVAVSGLRFLETFLASASANVMVDIFEKQDGEKPIDIFLKVVKESTKMLVSLARECNGLPSDITFTEKMRLALGSVSCLRRCWPCLTNQTELSGALVGVIPAMLELALHSSSIQSTVIDKHDVAAFRLSTTATCFTAEVLRILATHFANMLQQGSLDLNSSTFRALNSASGQNLDSFVSVIGPLMGLTNSGTITTGSGSVSEVSHPEVDPLELLETFKSPSILEGHAIDLHDACAASKWLSAKNVGRPEVMTAKNLLEISAIYERTAAEVARMKSWVHCIVNLISLLKEWRKLSPDSQIFSIDEDCFCRSLLDKSLDTMADNCAFFQNRHGGGGRRVVSLEKQMAEEVGVLLVAILPTSGSPVSLSSLDKISAISHKVFESTRRFHDELNAVDKLLAVGGHMIAFSKGKKTEQTHDSVTRILSVTCDVINGLSGHDTSFRTIRIALSVLVASVTRSESFSTPESMCLVSSSLLADILTKYSTIPTLAHFVTQNTKVSSNLSIVEDGCLRDIVATRAGLLDLLTALCGCNDSSLAPVLEHNEVSSMVLSLFADAGEVGKKQEKQAMEIKKSHSDHREQIELLVALWTFLAASVEFTVSLSTHNPSLYYPRVSTTILLSQAQSVLSTLNSSDILRHGEVLRISSLQRSGAILSLLSALCNPSLLGEFKEASQTVFDELIAACKGLTKGLSHFLGASVSARSTFICSSNDDGHPLSPTHSVSPVLSTAKHDAIRFAHFVLQKCRPETKEELEAQRLINGRMPLPDLSPHSTEQAQLERNCRKAVTNSFTLRVESHTAQCAHHALQILTKSHPARSRMLKSLSPDISRIQPGMLVTFESSTTPDEIERGRVCLVDTIARRVKTFSGDWVLVSSLRTVEDMSKRSSIVEHRTAPSTATELEADRGQLSLGDLLLLLRWCYDKSPDVVGSIRKRLAEACRSLIALEIWTRDPSTIAGPLREQLLELFQKEVDPDECDWHSMRDELLMTDSGQDEISQEESSRTPSPKSEPVTFDPFGNLRYK